MVREDAKYKCPSQKDRIKDLQKEKEDKKGDI